MMDIQYIKQKVVHLIHPTSYTFAGRWTTTHAGMYMLGRPVKLYKIVLFDRHISTFYMIGLAKLQIGSFRWYQNKDLQTPV